MNNENVEVGIYLEIRLCLKVKEKKRSAKTKLLFQRQSYAQSESSRSV